MASNKMLIDASHPEETRVVVLRGNRIEEFDFESQNKRQLKGNIYLAKVTRVEPSLQAAFIDYGGNRHGFLAFNEIHPDYYQIPVADRQALLDEEAADAARDNAEEERADIAAAEKQEQTAKASSIEDDQNGDDDDEAVEEPRRKRRQRRPRKKPAAAKTAAEADDADNSENNADADNNSDEETDSSTATPKSATRKPKTRRKTRSAAKSDDVAEPVEDENKTLAPADEAGDSADSEASLKETASDDSASQADSDTDASKDDETSSSSDDEADGSDKPTSMAAMMETDSISEAAPDEDAPEDGEGDESAGSDEDSEAEAAKKPPVKKRARSNRRPRKKAKAEVEETPIEEKAADEVVAIAADSETSKSEEKPADEVVADVPVAEGDNANTDESSAQEQEEAPKAKPRKRRRSSKSRRNADKETAETDDNSSSSKQNNASENGNGDNDDSVESSGQEDAMEEVPQRRRSRRQYKIQEVIKRRQVLLVQVVKEERGNKGAALTTYLSLAGRYSVLMPNTARGGGISRKITNAADRKRLKTIAGELEVPEGMGVILRTAGASRTKAEIQRDFEYLMRLWENVRNLTLSSSAPCLVYEEGSLIKRSIRDLYDKNTGEVLVAGEAGHKEARDFMAMLMPNHAAKVKLYQDEQAMFARFGVEQQLDKMLGQQVTLKSGGYLVIDQTEALVAVDVNSGRATREHSIEDTALQTNLETAEEVARQLRLRDLAGLIVIDFIDMEEKRNNRAVEKKLKECLKNDRARIQVGRISHFGLLEMSRQRMRASVLDSTMDICPHCQGKGHTRSSSSVSLHILRAIEEHLLKNSRFDLVVKTANEAALFILNHKRSALVEIEKRFGLKIFIEGTHELLGENFTLEKGEPSTGERKPVNHIQVGQMSDGDVDVDDVDISSETSDGTSDDAPAPAPAEETTGKRRRRRGRGNRDRSAANDEGNSATSEDNGENEPENRKRQRGRRGRRKPADNEENSTETTAQENAASDSASTEQASPAPVDTSVTPPVESVEAETTPARRSRNSRPRKAKAKTEVTENNDAPVEASSDAVDSSPPPEPAVENSDNPPAELAPAKRRTTRRRKTAATAETASDDGEAKSPPENETPQAAQAASNNDEETSMQVAPEEAEGGKKKRGGWWSRNGFFR